MKNQRLYTVLQTAYPDAALEWVPEEKVQAWEEGREVGERQGPNGTEFAFYRWPWEPKGWAEFSIKKWGPRTDPETGNPSYVDFFWPKTDKIWRSRSSAQKVVNIIESWGGSAIILECTPVWEPVSDANARRKRERNASKIARLRAELEALEAA